MINLVLHVSVVNVREVSGVGYHRDVFFSDDEKADDVQPASEFAKGTSTSNR